LQPYGDDSKLKKWLKILDQLDGKEKMGLKQQLVGAHVNSVSSVNNSDYDYSMEVKRVGEKVFDWLDDLGKGDTVQLGGSRYSGDNYY
jgi:hypothetical protein